MDLNYLLHRHQMSLFRADAAPTLGARRAHAGLASLYERAIADLYGRRGLATSGSRPDWLGRPAAIETE